MTCCDLFLMMPILVMVVFAKQNKPIKFFLVAIITLISFIGEDVSSNV